MDKCGVAKKIIAPNTAFARAMEKKSVVVSHVEVSR